MEQTSLPPQAHGPWPALGRVGFVIVVAGLAFFSLTAAAMTMIAIVLAVIHHRATTLVAVSFGPLRAKLAKELDEAEQLTERLKGLAVEQGRAVIASAAYTGRFASGDDWIYAAARRVEAGLVEIGATPDQLAEARSDLVDLTIEDAGRIVLGSGRMPPDREAEAEWRALVRQSGCKDTGAIERWLRRRGYMTQEREMLLADMDWMILHRTIRDVAQYRRAHTPLDPAWPAAPATANVTTAAPAE